MQNIVLLMRPFPRLLDDSQKIFNYRLSRARRTIERIFKRPIRASTETDQSIIWACVCLHNYLQTKQSSSNTPQGFIDVEGFNVAIKEGDWRNIIKHDSALNSFTKAKGGGGVSHDAKVVQSSLKSYLNSAVEQVGWQWDCIKRTGLSRKS